MIKQGVFSLFLKDQSATLKHVSCIGGLNRSWLKLGFVLMQMRAKCRQNMFHCGNLRRTAEGILYDECQTLASCAC